MRLLRSFFLALVLALTASPAFAGEQFALLIGVRDYTRGSLTPLKYCENDVSRLAEVLRDHGYKSRNVVLLTTTRGQTNPAEAPTATNIRAALRRILRARGKDDRVLIAFSGHGIQFKGSQENYLCPEDTDLGGEAKLSALAHAKGKDTEAGSGGTGLSDRSNLVAISEIYRQLQRSKAGFKLLLLDCCRNDPLAADERLEKIATPQLKKVPDGFAALFSCSKGESALEDSRLKHGIFFYHVIKGLNGAADGNKNGEVTLTELHDYLDEVTRYAKEQCSAKQTPELEGRFAGRVPLVQLNVKKPVLSVALRDLSSAELKSRNLTHGVRVLFPFPGGTAEKAGLKENDVLLSLDGKPIKHNVDLRRQYETCKLGQTLPLEIQRDGKTVRLEVTLEQAFTESKRIAAYQKLAEAGNADAQYYLGMGYRMGQGGLEVDFSKALTWLKKAALGGNFWALNEVGRHYALAWGVPKDPVEAVKWYRKAAAKGDSAAMSNLGTWYERGWDGQKPDIQEAVVWFKKAAERGYPYAVNKLAWLYLTKPGLKDETEAARWIRKSAELGDAWAQDWYGWMLTHGRGVKRDQQSAIQWLRKAVEQGHPQAYLNLAMAYAEGRGVDKNDKQALILLREAVDSGNSGATNLLGFWYERGLHVEKDVPQAARYYRQAADLGNGQAAYNLGLCYFYARGVEKSLPESFRWCKKAADLGHTWGKCRLGWMYEYGYGTDKDANEAVRYYRQSAAAGLTQGMENLGLAYYNGRGVEKNQKIAVRLFERAAKAGQVSAMYRLGFVYLNGQGGRSKSTESAFDSFKKAADKNHVGAINQVGVMYARGQGTTKNLSEAARCYRKAAERGERWAQQNLGIVLEQGQGVRKNVFEAVRWYRKSAAQPGMNFSAYRLGYIYDEGVGGIEKDAVEARKWYHLSHKGGYVAATYRLSWLYRNGRGGEKDLSMAFALMRQAARKGYTYAMRDLAFMYERGIGTAKNTSQARYWREKAGSKPSARPTASRSR